MRRLSTATIVIAVFLGGVAVGRIDAGTLKPGIRINASPGPRLTAPGELPAPLDADKIREVWDVLHEKFSGSLDDERLSRGALRGIVVGTGDPYSAYADPQESKQFAEDLNGEFSGIGVEIGLRRGLVTVIAPLRGSPAERAGIRARDVVVKIDNQSVEQQVTLSDIVSKIRGKPGTSVHLTIAREGGDEFLEFTVRRERIAIESVKLEMRDGLALLTVSTFNEDTPRRVDQAAREILGTRARGILLDLRNNPGGLLDASVDIAGHFLPKGTLVVKEVPRQGLPPTEHHTEGSGDLGSLPLVVLTNGGSASASEIVAAALREQRDVPTIGEQTFGKGSVQELVELSDGATVRVTIARWHTPQGKEIDEKGIAPTIEVKDENPAEDPDEILERGLEILRQRVAGGNR
ncbi:MAG: S41 family peptidase [bacterium]|nr:S41 family peptidase [bacterium]